LGLGKSRNKEQAIRLMDRNTGGDNRHKVYRDDSLEGRQRQDGDDRPRRDSDALGSLAGSPTEDRFNFLDSHPPGGSGQGGNAFRDELARQNKERL
jgi:hypothetical protein